MGLDIATDRLKLTEAPVREEMDTHLAFSVFIIGNHTGSLEILGNQTKLDEQFKEIEEQNNRRS